MDRSSRLPERLHHTAYVSRDLEATRHFYEDIIGLPLIATWCEKDLLFGKERSYCHTFFGIADGGALAFFQFADAEDEEEFVPEMPQTPFVHIALKVGRDNQDAIWARLEQNGYREPDVFALEHGYCRSIYARDPNGMLIEFCCDADLGADLVEEKRATARSELQRWLAGDRSSNNHLSHR